MQALLNYNKFMKKYYAVRKGKTPGIYDTWDECKDQVMGYSGAEYKKFNTENEAKNFMEIGTDKKRDIPISDETMIAYVDGSYNSLDGSYSYGAVIISNEGTQEFGERFKKDKYSEHRNVIGEIRGSVFAMNLALKNGYKRLILHYDYEGIEKWATGAWKRNKEATILYHEYFKSIKDKLKVDFVKVKAHSGDKYNEMADKLAKEAKIKEN